MHVIKSIFSIEVSLLNALFVEKLANSLGLTMNLQIWGREAILHTSK
jgi:hypothetical protein